MFGRLSSPQVLEEHQHFLFHFNGNKYFQEASFSKKMPILSTLFLLGLEKQQFHFLNASGLCFLLNLKVSGVSNAEKAERLDN